MKKLTIGMTILSIVLSLVFSGCNTMHEGPTYGEKVVLEDGAQFTFKLNTVAILDEDLQKWEYLNDRSQHDTKSKIAVENLGIKSLSTGNVEVFTTIRNRTKYPLQLSVRSQFYDDNKIVTEDPTVWKRVFLPQNSVATYKERSISINNVTNFLIEVKEGE